METAAQRLIIALDDIDKEKIVDTITKTRTFATTYKIGLALFVAHGPQIIHDVQSLGVDVFLDLKLHDIPMQVRRAVDNALLLKPRFLTVHAHGGAAMLTELAHAARGSSTKILAVTVLTSISHEDAQRLGMPSPLSDHVRRLADLALSCGIDGLVTSPQELSVVRAHVGNDAYLVCPGIRNADEDAHDQARTLNAYDVIMSGADALVVGRPITQAHNSLLRAQSIHAEIERALLNDEG